jgi:hypothetical protein
MKSYVAFSESVSCVGLIYEFSIFHSQFRICASESDFISYFLSLVSVLDLQENVIIFLKK